MRLTDEQRRIVEENLWMVAFATSKIRQSIMISGLSMDDARQAGHEALCKAVARWSPERGALSSYAIPYVRGAVQTVCRENSLVRVPSSTLYAHPEWRVRVDYLSAPISNEGEGDFTMEDVLADTKDTEARCLATDLWDQFTSREQVILEARLRGNTQKEAGRAAGLSQSHTSRCLQSARRKAERYLALCAE